MFNLKQIYFYLVLPILFIPLYVEYVRASAVIPNDIEITIMEESTKATIKRNLVVLLNKRVTETVLRAIAYKLKASDHVLYQRTFIAYNIKNRDTANGFWARTDFTPNLNVRIIGLTVEQAKETRIPQPKLYKTVYDLFIDRNDYTPDEQYNDGIGQFRVLKNKPILHIEINPTVVKGDILSYKEDTKKAVLYGIYKTFIHTSTNKIKVTATPRELTSKSKLSEFSKTVTITRTTALKLVNKALGVSSFKELVTPSFYKGTFITYVYSDICKNILYNGKRYLPGLDKFFIILEQDIKQITQHTPPLVTSNQAVTLPVANPKKEFDLYQQAIPHYISGLEYFNQKKFNEAIEEFKKAIEIKPDYSSAYHNLSKVYKKLGMVDEAKETYDMARSLQ